MRMGKEPLEVMVKQHNLQCGDIGSLNHVNHMIDQVIYSSSLVCFLLNFIVLVAYRFKISYKDPSIPTQEKKNSISY